MRRTAEELEAWSSGGGGAHMRYGTLPERRERSPVGLALMLFELLQASGCAHYVEVWVQEAWYS